MRSETRHHGPRTSEAGVVEARPEIDQAALLSMHNLVGRKWHLVLVQHLLRSAPLGFSELEERIDGISAKVLSESLSDLENRGVVQRRIVNERPIRVEYSLSQAGEALEPVVESLRSWGETHLDAPDEERA